MKILNNENRTERFKLILFSLVLLSSISIYAQTNSGFGFKGGLNYNGNGDYFESVSNNYQRPLIQWPFLFVVKAL